MTGTKEQIITAKIILKYRGKKVKWATVWDAIVKKVPDFDYSDFLRLTKVTTKNLKTMGK